MIHGTLDQRWDPRSDAGIVNWLEGWAEAKSLGFSEVLLVLLNTEFGIEVGVYAFLNWPANPFIRTWSMNFESISSGLSQGSQQNDVLTTGHRSYWSCAHPHVTWHKPDVQGFDLGFTLKQQVLDCWCKVCFICPWYLWRIHRKSWSQRALQGNVPSIHWHRPVVGTKCCWRNDKPRPTAAIFQHAGSGGGWNTTQ